MTTLICANDAPPDLIADCDAVCDGVRDDVEIQAALDALASEEP